jgi:anti-anti-sigma factor
MNHPSYSIEDKDNFHLISLLDSKFTARIAPDLKADLVELKSKKVKYIIFDLEQASYCDSSGLSAILVANRICKELGGCMVVCNLQAGVEKLIEISQLNNILTITPSLNEAVDFVFMDDLEKGLGEMEDEEG